MRFNPFELAGKILQPLWTYRFVAKFCWDTAQFKNLRRTISDLSHGSLLKRLIEFKVSVFSERAE